MATNDEQKLVRVDSIIRYANGGTPPNFGKVGLCHYCGGDPTVARGRDAIGTTGCICNPARPQRLTTEVGETSDQKGPL